MAALHLASICSICMNVTVCVHTYDQFLDFPYMLKLHVMALSLAMGLLLSLIYSPIPKSKFGTFLLMMMKEIRKWAKQLVTAHYLHPL